MLTRAFKGYNVPKSKGFRGKIYRDLRVWMLRVSRAEGDPGLITRFKVFRRSLTVNGFKSF